MSLKVDDVSNYVCNVTSLDVLLNLTSTRVSVSDISKALCGINEDQAVAMVESMLQNMDLGKLVQEVCSTNLQKVSGFQYVYVYQFKAVSLIAIFFCCSM